MAGGDVDDDGRLAEDMMNVEALLGHTVVQMVTDDLILHLLKTYSSDRDRVQKVVNEVRRTYLEEDLPFFPDEDDDVLLALDNPFLSSSGERTSNASSGSVLSSKDSPPTTSSEVVAQTTSSNSHSGILEIIPVKPILRPAKFNITAAVRNNPLVQEPSRTTNADVPYLLMNDSTAGSFANHRKADKTTDEFCSTSTEEDSEPGVSGSSTEEGSEPEVLSFRKDGRKRKKSYGSKSPGKKTRVEIVDLVNLSPKSALNCENYFSNLEAMFPDIDPLFLRQKFKNIENEQELNVVAASLLESKDYPCRSTGTINASQGEKPSTSNISNASVIIRSSAFGVPHSTEPQPSTSSNVHISNTVISDHNDKRKPEGDQFVLNPDIPAIGAVEMTTSLLQPGDTTPNFSAPLKDPYPLLTAVREFVATMSDEGNIDVPVTDASNQEMINRVSSHPAQAIPVPIIPAQSRPMDIPTSSALSHETSELLPTSQTLPFPSSHDKSTTPSSDLTEERGLIDSTVDKPGPSGLNNGHKKEKPWAEKYSTLLCLFPESDPKYLKNKAKLLHDKDIDFNLFVETTLENMLNPPPNEGRRDDIQVLPANPFQPVNVNIPVPSVPNPVPSGTNRPGSNSTNISGPNDTNVIRGGSANTKGPSEQNIPRLGNATIPQSTKTPVSSGVSHTGCTSSNPTPANIPRPKSTKVSRKSNSSAQIPCATSAPGPVSANVPQPSGANIPGPSKEDVRGPSIADVPGPNGINAAGSSGMNVAGPSGINAAGSSGMNVAGPSGTTGGGNIEPWSEKHSFLLSILPDADPTFLEEKAKSLHDKDEDLKTFVANALENKDYPTLKDYQRRQEIIALQNKYLNDFNIENFLEIVPEPFKYFSQIKRKPSPDSQERGSLYLKRKFRLIRSNDITMAYRKNQYNLTNTVHELSNFKGQPLKSRRPDFQIADKLPDTNISLQFLQEVAFIENEHKIKKYLRDKKEEEEKSLKEARDKGELLECNCCFDDEVLARNIVTCPEGHIFCKSCVRKGAETKIGEGETKFSCLTDCKAEFTLQSLQAVLKPTVFSKLAQRKQLEEIKAAGIEDLVQCPFCDFCNIPGTGDKIFRCLNPDCMKDSCIMCKEESHIPLRCDEVEKASEVKMRTYIEDKMTEALVRTCWKCQRKFVKIDGCNKMTCQCGALMCYICRQPVKDYSHFNGQGGDAYHKCPLFSDNNSLHVDAVERVAAEAKAELAQKHPGVTLKHDPTSVPIPREAGGRGPGQAPNAARGARAPDPFVQLARYELPIYQNQPRLLPQQPVVVLQPPDPAERQPPVADQLPAPAPWHVFPLPAAPAREVAGLVNVLVNRYQPAPLPAHHHVRHHHGHHYGHHHGHHYGHHHRQRRRHRNPDDYRNLALDIERLAAEIRRDREQLRVAERELVPIRQANVELAYQAELARPAAFPLPHVQPPRDVAAPNANAYYAQNMPYRHEYQHHPN